jgi:hypothetical protein
MPTWEALQQIPGLRIIGTTKERAGVISTAMESRFALGITAPSRSSDGSDLRAPSVLRLPSTTPSTIPWELFVNSGEDDKGKAVLFTGELQRDGTTSSTLVSLICLLMLTGSDH